MVLTIEIASLELRRNRAPKPILQLLDSVRVG